ncbi:hypothetical protein [Nostoc sp.]|uniref:hypothetical protein n=1 Tax=Nostoc sp. TaxID=1180 RepID=UPI002FF907E6
MIPIGKLGQLVSGESPGSYVLVKDDTKNTGGYYIYISNTPNINSPLPKTYDYWVESESCLPEFFSDWEVEWT